MAEDRTAPAAETEENLSDILRIRRENRGCRPHLSTHIGDRGSRRDLQSCCAWSYILIYISKSAFDRDELEHF